LAGAGRGILAPIYQKKSKTMVGILSLVTGVISTNLFFEAKKHS